MTEKNSMIEVPTREQMLGFIERQLATLRPQIADFQARFRASVLGNDAHEQSATLFRDSLLLRLEYTQLCCERESFGPRWIPPDELAQFPPTEVPATPQPIQRQPMGFKKATEPTAD